MWLLLCNFGKNWATFLLQQLVTLMPATNEWRWCTSYLNVSRIMVKSTNFPSSGTTSDVGGMISASSKKNTVKDSKMENWRTLNQELKTKNSYFFRSMMLALQFRECLLRPMAGFRTADLWCRCNRPPHWFHLIQRPWATICQLPYPEIKHFNQILQATWWISTNQRVLITLLWNFLMRLALELGIASR